LTNFFRQYRALETSGLEPTDAFKLKQPISLSSAYPTKGVDVTLYKEEETDRLEKLIKNYLYS